MPDYACKVVNISLLSGKWKKSGGVSACRAFAHVVVSTVHRDFLTCALTLGFHYCVALLDVDCSMMGQEVEPRI